MDIDQNEYIGNVLIRKKILYNLFKGDDALLNKSLRLRSNFTPYLLRLQRYKESVEIAIPQLKYSNLGYFFQSVGVIFSNQFFILIFVDKN